MSEAKHTPGPWRACRNGECSCKFVWAEDHPVARVECGEWGDEYPSIRVVGSPLDAKAEPFIDKIAYGSVAEETALANARLISAAPDLLEALRDMRKRFHACCVASGTDAEFADLACEQADAAIRKATGEA